MVHVVPTWCCRLQILKALECAVQQRWTQFLQLFVFGLKALGCLWRLVGEQAGQTSWCSSSSSHLSPETGPRGERPRQVRDQLFDYFPS
jgi:hypothetical protein